MSRIEIRKATLHDLEVVCSIILDCKRSMTESGDVQWPDHHPSPEEVKKGVVSGQHFIASIGEEVVGGVLLNHSSDEQYKSIDWRFRDDNPLIVHRLAVSPKFQGRGVAKELMRFAERYARLNGCVALRLDTFGENKTSSIFYEKLGYERAGTIQMPQYMPGNYVCYEKEVVV